MAPQATLTFTPSLGSSSRDPFDLTSLGSFALWPFSPPRSPQLPTNPVPSEHLTSSAPVPPTVSVTGPFSLLRGGVLQVGNIQVRIDRGTFVGKSTGLGYLGRDSRGLWWIGTGTRGEKGVWDLQLLRATDADALAVHRLLLYLPPTPRPSFPVPHPVQAPAYRNSLLLYDEDNNRVVSAVPIESPSRPARGPLPPLPTSKPLPPAPSIPPRPLSRGADLARYVDRVVQGIHPDPTPESLSAAERLEQGRIARQANREENEWDPFMLGDILLATPPADSRRDLAVQKLKSDEEEEEEENSATGSRPVASTEKRSSGTLAPPVYGPGTGLSHSISTPSEWSVSSFATFGSERFVTADEFASEAESSKRSSVAPGNALTATSSLTGFALVKADDDDDDITPTPTRIDTSRPAQAKVSSRADDLDTPAREPSHTLTNGNAVLLSFLGGPSVLSSDSLSSSSPTRIKVSAHPLSSDEITARVRSGTIKPAEVEMALEGGEKGLFEWLSSLLKLRDSNSPHTMENGHEGTGEITSKGWLAWLLWPWNNDQNSPDRDSPQHPPTSACDDILSSSHFTTSAASSLPLSPTVCLPSTSSPPSPSDPVRRQGRSSGESITRLSLIYVNGQGQGSKVYLDSERC